VIKKAYPPDCQAKCDLVSPFSIIQGQVGFAYRGNPDFARKRPLSLPRYLESTVEWLWNRAPHGSLLLPWSTTTRRRRACPGSAPCRPKARADQDSWRLAARCLSTCHEEQCGEGAPSAVGFGRRVVVLEGVGSYVWLAEGYRSRVTTPLRIAYRVSSAVLCKLSFSIKWALWVSAVLMLM
jgi:hypothetical protein